MAIEKLFVYSLCLVTLIGRSHSVNTTDTLVPSIQDLDINVSTTSSIPSDLTTTPLSISISTVPFSSQSTEPSKSVLADVSSSPSDLALVSVSSTTYLSPSTAVSQNVNTATQNVSAANSTTEGNEPITTLNPGSSTTNFSFNKWSNTFPGITSNAASIGFTSPPVDHSSITETNSTHSSNASISLLVNDTVHGRPSTVISEQINTTQTSVTGLTSTKESSIEGLTSFSDSLHPSSTEPGNIFSAISDIQYSSSYAKDASSHVTTSSISAPISSDELHSPHVDFTTSFMFISNDVSTAVMNVSKSSTVLASPTTNYFKESVYSLANISTTFVPDLEPSPSSAMITVLELSESSPGVTSSVQSSLQNGISSSTASSFGSNASFGLSPTTETVNISSVPNTVSRVDLYSSESVIYSSKIVVSSSSEHHFELSSFPSSNILASDILGSINVNNTPTLDIRMKTQSVLITASAESDNIIPSNSFTSNMVRQVVTQSASLSPTATSEQSVIISVTSQTTTEGPSTNRHSSTSHTSIQTTSENSTGLTVEKDHNIYRMIFTFDGHCEILSENDVLQMEFLKALMAVVKSTTKLSSYSLEAERILCEPLRVYLRTETRGFNISHISEPLDKIIASSEFIVPIIQSTHVLNFTAINLEIVKLSSSDIDGLEVARSGLEVVDIVIISIASFLFAVLVLMMVIVICRECYVRKRTTTFHLRDVPHVNLKLSDFTLTRIPRPQMFYRENSRRKHGPIPVSKLRKSQSNGHSDTKDKVKVNQDQIRVRMSKHDDGLVVGVTCSAPPSPSNNSSSCSSTPRNGDSSKTSLLKGGNAEISDGVTNPSYSTDDELNGNTKILIQEDENEQLL
ncbi:mucin-5AC-like isoform X2 [Ruditapes philippinarum]|nr:mucin-5AC-like isoform X2 [Ruditapes philippinarum]